eukprot:GHVQ01024815.1.p1 GENE.GHVQ01024815.1~~GHVQ01024815.1.p1  ORF type:complete len:532 (-),score=58.22 GHVQ01024815.1:689-2284(-)
MKYRSTRGGTIGGAKFVGFSDAVLTGLAEDGGLLIPIAIPRVLPETISKWKHLDFCELCYELMKLFIDSDDIPGDDLREIIEQSFVRFRHKEKTPVSRLGDFYLLELFHGPTYAFKDVALQFLGVLFDYILRKRKQRMVVLGATSGDTGSAAISGMQGRPNIDCVILFPKGRTSRIQELQMVTCDEPNVYCVAVDGTFDDCQNLVKECFTSPLKQELNLGAVNSINWARILAQMVYYWYAAFRVLAQEPQSSLVNFSVPTGNFGNILAGYYAQCMGAPIGRLIIASNSNDILVKFRNTGEYHLSAVTPTMSPSMDIQVSSNFERFLHDVMGGNSKLVSEKFAALQKCGGFTVGEDVCNRTQQVFPAFKATEGETVDAIRLVHDSYGTVLDPHTAVGFVCAKKFQEQNRVTTGDKKSDGSGEETGGESQNPMVCVSTAHFGKFYESVEPYVNARTLSEQTPEDLMLLDQLPQRCDSMKSSQQALQYFLRRKFHPTAVDKVINWCSDNPWSIVLASVALAGTAMTFFSSRRWA